MLSQLHQQLHFVRQIQDVDVEGVEPLARIQDETQEAQRERTHDLESMKDVLKNERWVGRWNRRVRQAKSQEGSKENENWDVLGQARRKVGRFFVVEGGGGREQG